MRTPTLMSRYLLVSPAILCAMLLTACGKPSPSPAPADQPPPSPTEEAPASAPAPSEVPPPDESPAAPAQPSPDAPPPTESSPAPKPTAAANEPALDSMQLAGPAAKSSAKLSVPVDLHYSFDGQPLANQPVTLHLAAVPRVTGTHLTVSFKKVQGIDVTTGGALNVQKATAHGAYRQQYAVTRQASAPAEIRVLVTMDLPEGQAFGFFSVPFEAAPKPGKQDSVKQR
jgi:hypothetical protein